MFNGSSPTRRPVQRLLHRPQFRKEANYDIVQIMTSGKPRQAFIKYLAPRSGQAAFQECERSRAVEALSNIDPYVVRFV